MNEGDKVEHRFLQFTFEQLFKQNGFFVSSESEAQNELIKFLKYSRIPEPEKFTKKPDLFCKRGFGTKPGGFVIECATFISNQGELNERKLEQLSQFSSVVPTYLGIYEDTTKEIPESIGIIKIEMTDHNLQLKLYSEIEKLKSFNAKTEQEKIDYFDSKISSILGDEFIAKSQFNFLHFAIAESEDEEKECDKARKYLKTYLVESIFRIGVKAKILRNASAESRSKKEHTIIRYYLERKNDFEYLNYEQGSVLLPVFSEELDISYRLPFQVNSSDKETVVSFSCKHQVVWGGKKQTDFDWSLGSFDENEFIENLNRMRNDIFEKYTTKYESFNFSESWSIDSGLENRRMLFGTDASSLIYCIKKLNKSRKGKEFAGIEENDLEKIVETWHNSGFAYSVMCQNNVTKKDYLLLLTGRIQYSAKGALIDSVNVNIFSDCIQAQYIPNVETIDPAYRVDEEKIEIGNPVDLAGAIRISIGKNTNCGRIFLGATNQGKILFRTHDDSLIGKILKNTFPIGLEVRPKFVKKYLIDGVTIFFPPNSREYLE